MPQFFNYFLQGGFVSTASSSDIAMIPGASGVNNTGNIILEPGTQATNGTARNSTATPVKAKTG